MDDNYLKKINRDFIDLKEIVDDHEKIKEYFNFDASFYTEILNILKVSKELGYIEARESFLTEIKARLDEAKYKTLTGDKIDELLRLTTKLLFVTIISRRVLSGDYFISSNKIQSFDDIKKIDLKTIVSSVKVLSVEYEELSNNRNFKDISNQLIRYNSELKKIGEMVKVINEDKKKQFLENANKELTIILTSIKKNYYSILEYINEKENKIKNEENLLAILDFKSILKIYKEQLSNFSKLRSSILFIIQERYNFQEIIEKNYNKLDENKNLLHEEEKKMISLLISNKINSTEIDRLIVSITDMSIKIIEKNYI